MQPTEGLKIICLNTWAGMIGIETLLSFFKMYQDADVFCLQEIYHTNGQELPKVAAGRSIENVEPKLLEKLQATLPDHLSFYIPQYAPYIGLAMFFRKDLSIIEQGSLCIYKEPGYVSPHDIADHARMMQYLTLETARGPLTILNLHAAWQVGGKTDTPERLEQSQRILDFSKSITHPLVMCGDFNLLPTTQSIQMIEQAGWENLIRTNQITSTRTSLYEKPERFADYVFVKNNVQVQNFRVLPEEVSDHAALLLECV